MKSLMVLLIAMLLTFSALAAIDTLQFDSVEQEQQYRQLTASLRCPKCQNNSIADSNAMIAGDMRMKVYQLTKQGQSPQQITDYMVARYGNFVTYQPPLTASTLILWAGPAVFVLLGTLVIIVRGRGHRSSPVLDAEPQQTLLTDILQTAAPQARSISRWVLAPGVLVILFLPLALYFKVGGLPQLMLWQQVKSQFPALHARVMDPQAAPLSLDELARLGLGLRSELQQDPGNLANWMMLGRVGMVLNNVTTASQAFRHALQLDGNNPEVKLSYAEVLTRSGDAQDNRDAEVMLQDMLKSEPHNLRVLGLLAVNGWQQQHYDSAIAHWQQMLALLPPGDRQIAAIERSITQAKSAAGEQNSQLGLTVSLSPAAEKMLPAGGVLYISVSDGVSPLPVAVKKLPLSHFPLSLTLDDSNAMMPERLLSAQHQVQVSVRISRDGSATLQSGDWQGESALTPYDGHQRLAVEINQQR